MTTSNHAAQLEVAKSQLAECKQRAAKLEREIELLDKRPDKDDTAVEDDLTEPIMQFFAMYEEFSQLPRTRGIGHKLEAWKTNQDITAKTTRALTALHTLEKARHE